MFKHEVENALSTNSFDNPSSDRGRLPLPPEGQPKASTYETQEKNTGKILREQKRFWEAGWYLWFSKSHWALQEHLDLMQHTLESNARLMKHKSIAERKILEAERAHRQGEPINFRRAKDEVLPLYWSTARTS